MPRFYKSFSIFLIIFALLLPTTAFSQPVQTPKNWLMAFSTEDKQEKFVGVMANEITCRAIAQALNQWAAAPPKTPLIFHCEPEPLKV